MNFVGVIRSHKMRLQLLKDSASEALLDLDALSGLTEISLEKEEGSGVKYITKFGVSTGPSFSNVMVPSQTVTVVPRHAVINESEETIIVRQWYLEVLSQSSSGCFDCGHVWLIRTACDLTAFFFSLFQDG